MVNWAQMYDWHSDVDRVPELLDRVERGDGGEVWTELGHRLILERDLVSLAGIAALPRLVRLAARSTEARHLAGEIMERAAGRHGGDDLLVDSVDSIAEFGILLDRHLQSRPADYLVTFRALLAVREQYHWANVLGDFADDFYDLPCSRAKVRKTDAGSRISQPSSRRTRPFRCTSAAVSDANHGSAGEVNTTHGERCSVRVGLDIMGEILARRLLGARVVYGG